MKNSCLKRLRKARLIITDRKENVNGDIDIWALHDILHRKGMD